MGRVTRRVLKLDVDIDERARDMPLVALQHRGSFHPWVFLPASPKRYREMAALGYREEVRECTCGAYERTVYNRRTGEAVERESRRTKDYKVPPGTGRMPKSAARIAAWAVEDAELYRRRPAR